MTTKRRRRSSKAPSPAQRRARAAFAAASRARSRRAAPARRRVRRRRNPIASRPGLGTRWKILGAAPSSLGRRRARRRNPVRVIRSRRRRNPISLGNASSYIGMIKDGLVGGAGALAVDVAYGYIAPYLPASLQRTPGVVGVGDGVKALVTIVLGKLLDRPTRGLASKAARGALVVQAHGILATFLPSTMQLGYYSPATVSNMSNRIGPNRRALARYTQPGATPLLQRYTQSGVSPLLNSRGSVMAREGFSVR